MSRVQRALSSLLVLAVLSEVIGFATGSSFNPATFFTEANIASVVVLSVLAALMFGNLLALLLALLMLLPSEKIEFNALPFGFPPEPDIPPPPEVPAPEVKH